MGYDLETALDLTPHTRGRLVTVCRSQKCTTSKGALMKCLIGGSVWLVYAHTEAGPQLQVTHMDLWWDCNGLKGSTQCSADASGAGSLHWDAAALFQNLGGGGWKPLQGCGCGLHRDGHWCSHGDWGPFSPGVCVQVHIYSSTRNGNCFLTVWFVSWARLALLMILPPLLLFWWEMWYMSLPKSIFSVILECWCCRYFISGFPHMTAVLGIVHPQSSCQAAQKGALSWVLLQRNSISSNSKPLLIWLRGAGCSWQRQCCSPETGQYWEEMRFVHLYWNWLKEGSTFIHFWVFGCVAVYLLSLSPCRGVCAALYLSGSPCEQLSAQSSK